MVPSITSEVSILHNIVHLLFAVGLVAAARYSWSRFYLIGGGIAYLGVLLYGVLVERDSDANFLPINDADNLLHLSLALLMIARTGERAGDGDRTRIASLEGWSSTIELHPQSWITGRGGGI